MSNATNTTPTTPDRTTAGSDHRPRRTTETKSALKTTEFFVYVLVVIGIIVTATVVGDGEGDGSDLFGALPATQLVVAVSIAYLLARGLAKSGSRENYDA